MKKTILISLCIGILFAVFGGWGAIQTAPKEKTPLPSVISQIEKSTKIISVSPSFPRTLRIKKINVTAQVESVGMDTTGAMDIPKKEMNVAWYNLGAKPGEQGSAVIAGHLDTKSGDPAVFWDLDKLRPNDTLEVIDEEGQTFTYVVTHQKTFDFDKVPLQEIFARSDAKYLNLITCEGIFNKANKNYSKRLVVYSTLVN